MAKVRCPKCGERNDIGNKQCLYCDGELIPSSKVKKENSPDLLDRMEKEIWQFDYEGKTDTLFLSGKVPIGSYYTVINDNLMLRVDNDQRIFGVAIKDFKKTAKKNYELKMIKKSLFTHKMSLWFYGNKKIKLPKEFYSCFGYYSAGKLAFGNQHLNQ
jgi:hypothetical protein